MKYLKKSAEVLIGKAGSQNEQELSKYGLTDHTAMLTLVTHYSHGSGEELSGICVTHEHLEQMRNAINDYLSKIDNNAPISEEVGSVNNFYLKVETGLNEAQTLKVFGQFSQQVKQMLQNNNQQKQTQLAIDPKLVMVNQYKPTGEPNSWFAKIRVLTGIISNPDGRIELEALGDSEENVRKELNVGFHNLIMACVNPDSSESRIPDIAHENQQKIKRRQGLQKLTQFLQDEGFYEDGRLEDLQDLLSGDRSSGKNQQPVNSTQDTKIKSLRLDTGEVTSKKTDERWEASTIVYWNDGSRALTAFGDTEAEAIAQLHKELILFQDHLSANHFSAANEAENSEQINESNEKGATQFKLNPSRFMSMKIGTEKWEARTRLFNGMNFELIDLVAKANSEEEAREELNNKFSNFARGMTNFIKFMSQDY